MLILTRNPSDSVYLGHFGEVEFKIIEVGNQRVKVGILAPQDVPIFRNEHLHQEVRSAQNL